MSGTEYDLTANFQLKKPWIDADDDIWGIHLNQNMDLLDNLLQTRGFAQAYLPLAGGVMGGMITLFADPVGMLDAATKRYVDAGVASAGTGKFLPLIGGTVTGPIGLPGNATLPLHAVPLQQLNAATAGGPFLPLVGGTVSGPIVLPGNATLPLQAVPLQQLNAATAGGPFLPLTGGTVSGATTFQSTLTANAAVVTGLASATNLWANNNPNATAPSGNLLGLAVDGPDGGAVTTRVSAYANNAAMTVRRAQGTAASPSGFTGVTQIGSLQFYGHDGTGYASGANAMVSGWAAAAWSATSHPCHIAFFTTPTNSIAQVEMCRMSASGNLLLGTTVDGTNKLDVVGAVRLNGNLGFNNTTPIAKPTVAGACAGNTAIKALLTALVSYGLVVDTTTV